MQHVELKVYRSKNAKLQSFTIPFQREMTVLDALNFIKDSVDGGLTYRWSCRMGICGSCGMMVNGKPMLTCQTYVKFLCASEVDCSDCIPSITVEPLRHFPVVKDLVVDIDDPMEKMRQTMPWSRFKKNAHQKAPTARLQTPRELAKIDQTSQCIKCMLCYSACPVYGLDKKFLGPAAGALAFRHQMDSREDQASKKKRLDRITGKNDVWNCSFVGECSVVCPKRVDPALALQRLKIMGLKHIVGDIFSKASPSQEDL